MDSYKHDVGQDYKSLPEIYQIEVCSACNLQCPMCERTTHMGRKPGLVSLDLLETMYKRGDFGGSYFVELQMAGEPTLHPNLHKIITFLKEKVGVMVGLSTHGLNMSNGNIATLLGLDALTISIDSIDPEIYSKMRYPARLPDLVANLDRFMAAARTRKRSRLKNPFIEFQLINTEMFAGTGNVEALELFVKDKGWTDLVSIRTTGDSFIEMQDRGKVEKRNKGLCLNPWRSVSITHSGEVVSCCYIFDPKKDQVNYYGNLNEQSLAEIWAGPQVAEMQRLHRIGEMKDQCAKCYQPSPCEIHTQILSRLVKIR